MKKFYTVLINEDRAGRLFDTEILFAVSKEMAESLVKQRFDAEWMEFLSEKESDLVEQYNQHVEHTNLELREMMKEPRLYSEVSNISDADNDLLVELDPRLDIWEFENWLPCHQQFDITECSWTLNSFSQSSTLSTNKEMEKAVFCLADWGRFFGIHNPRKTWNGWANPALNEESLQQLNKDWIEIDSPWRIGFDDVSKEYCLVNLEEKYESPPLPEIMFDDNVYYDLSGAGFCFDALDLTLEDLDADALHFLAPNHITCLEWAPEDMWHHLKKHLAEDVGLDKIRQDIADTVKGEDASSRTFLAWLIYNNRGITRKELGQALCAKNGRPYCRGYGSAFFNKTMPDSRTPCRGVLWDLIEADKPSSGYELTQKGLETFILDELPEETYRVEFEMHIGQFEDYQVHWFDFTTKTPSKEIEKFMDMFSATFDYLAVNDYHWALNMYNDQGGHVYHRSPDEGEYWNLNQEKEGGVWM